MIRQIERTWFEVWGSEQAQNRFLKGILALMILLAAVQAGALVILSLRGPVLITISPSETKRVLPAAHSSELTEAEISRALYNYMELRHNWDWEKIESRLKLAANYIEDGLLKKFSTQTAPQVKLAKERKISQKLYFDKAAANINMKTKTASVSGDRIIIVEGLRATNAQTFELAFQFGPRTAINPEGVYITAETLVLAGDEPAKGGKP